VLNGYECYSLIKAKSFNKPNFGRRRDLVGYIVRAKLQTNRLTFDPVLEKP